MLSRARHFQNDDGVQVDQEHAPGLLDGTEDRHGWALAGAFGWRAGRCSRTKQNGCPMKGARGAWWAALGTFRLAEPSSSTPLILAERSWRTDAHLPTVRSAIVSPTTLPHHLPRPPPPDVGVDMATPSDRVHARAPTPAVACQALAHRQPEANVPYPSFDAL